MKRILDRARPLWAAVKLGWAVESNWTDPFVFLVYQIVRPLFAAAILVVMFHVVTGKPLDSTALAHLYVGSAFFYLVIQSLVNIGFIVMLDRERFQMIRYIYLAPIGLGPYLAARGLSQVLAAIMAIGITLMAGVLALGIPISLTTAELPYFVTAALLGCAATLSLGVMLAGLSLMLANHGFEMPDGMNGVLFLLSGAVFTIDILPGPVASVARTLPWTWWLESLRRVLLDEPFIASLSHLSDGAVLGTLAATTAGTVLLSWGVLRGCAHLAVATGKLDQRTDH
ncbi:MAG TPA: ABC transporter permease [Acidobacteriota bacterium]|nr:ABC transporter permease [Acidobacteriota bacterium]